MIRATRSAAKDTHQKHFAAPYSESTCPVEPEAQWTAVPALLPEVHMPSRFPKGRGVAQPAASARALFTSDRATFLTGFARARGGVLAGVVQSSRVDATRHDNYPRLFGDQACCTVILKHPWASAICTCNQKPQTSRSTLNVEKGIPKQKYTFQTGFEASNSLCTCIDTANHLSKSTTHMSNLKIQWLMSFSDQHID